ncbi:MAG: DUF3299 domain-containing protein [Planctomycetota bacterium]
MSASVPMSSSAVSQDFPYRAISRGAVVGVICLIVSSIGLIPTFAFALVLTIPGLICGLLGWRAIQRYPDEFSGKTIAMVGTLGCAGLLLGGVAEHTYIYLTEVPEGYERIAFYELQTPENTEDRPAPLAFEIDGKPVFLKGYIHPSSGAGLLRQFILVPDLGTCCFGGQPRSSDMIEVTLPPGNTVTASFAKRKLAGTFKLNRLPKKKADFDNTIFYKLNVDQYK